MFIKWKFEVTGKYWSYFKGKEGSWQVLVHIRNYLSIIMFAYIYLYRSLKEINEKNLLVQKNKYEDLQEQYDEINEILERFRIEYFNKLKKKIFKSNF